jgi:hypothetical protein
MDMTSTFDYGAAKVTVRRAKVRDRLAVDAIQDKLAKGADIDVIVAVRMFGRLIAQSTVEGDLGFALPAPTASEADLRAAYEAWLDVDAELMDIWQRHLREVDAPLMPALAVEPKASAADPKK